MHGSACVLQTMAIDKYTLLNVFSYRGRSVSFNSLTKNQVKEARVPTTYYLMGLWEKEEWDWKINWETFQTELRVKPEIFAKWSDGIDFQSQFLDYSLHH